MINEFVNWFTNFPYFFFQQIREICCLYQEAPHNTAPGSQRAQGASSMYRHEVINNLQLDHALVILVADNLTAYVDQVRHNPPKVSFS